MNQFIKVTFLAGSGFFLVNQFEVVLIELLKKFLLGDFPQSGIVFLFRVRELEAQNSGFSIRVSGAYFGRNNAARLCPPFNFLLIFGRFRKSHCVHRKCKE